MARADRRVARLDQPRVPGVSVLPSPDPEAFGRFAERIARVLGTGRYLVAQTIIIAVWLLWNVAVPKALQFDSYPFQFMTLILSLQAAYAAPLILLAQNRQDDRDRANLAQDRESNAMLTADAAYLTREVASLRVALGDVVTRDFLRAELRALLDELPGADGKEERPERSGKGKRKRDREAEREATGDGEKRRSKEEASAPAGSPGEAS